MNKLYIYFFLLFTSVHNNFAQNTNWTRLHTAVKNKDTKTIRKCIKNNDNIEAKTNTGKTPLLIAAEFGRIAAINALIKAKASIKAVDNSARGVLHLAAANNYDKAITRFIDAGAQINVLDNKQRTALRVAIKHCNPKAMLTLFFAGARNIGKGQDWTALHYAAKKNRAWPIKKLIEKTDITVESEDGKGNKPLHIAAQFNATNSIKTLIDKGADVDSQNNTGETPVHVAAQYNKHSALVQLFENDANIEATDTNRETPLHTAVIFNNAQIVDFFIENNVDIEAVNNLGCTPLHIAIDLKRIAIIKKLLAAHANTKAKPNNGWTTIHFAAKHGLVDLIKTLAKEGVDIHAINDKGETALHIAAQNGHSNVIDTLLDLHANIEARDLSKNTPLHYASSSGHVNAILTLLKRKANINAQNYLMSTPLHCSIASGKQIATHLLLDHNANLHVQDKAGRTPLTIALTSNNFFTASLLLLLGASWDYQISSSLKESLYKTSKSNVNFLVNTNQQNLFNRLYSYKLTNQGNRRISQLTQKMENENSPRSIFSNWTIEKQRLFVKILTSKILNEKNNNDTCKKFNNELIDSLAQKFSGNEIERKISATEAENNSRIKFIDDYYKVLSNQKRKLEDLSNDTIAPWAIFDHEEENWVTLLSPATLHGEKTKTQLEVKGVFAQNKTVDTKLFFNNLKNSAQSQDKKKIITGFKKITKESSLKLKQHLQRQKKNVAKFKRPDSKLTLTVIPKKRYKNFSDIDICFSS